jgi:very-short-patch-repair endonuclease
MHDVERAIAAIAAQQDDVITTAQLRAAGLGRGAVQHRLRSGWMQSVYRGVCVIGCAPPRPAQRMRAALLLAGDGAVLSHRTAAALWRLPVEAGADVEITVPGRHIRDRPGLRVHRSHTLANADIRVRDGLPLTSPTRTLFDIAATAPADEVEAAFTEAIVRRLTSSREIHALAARCPEARGAARVLAMLAVEEEHGYSRAKSERILRTLLKQARVPMPDFNVIVCGHRVDCRWAKQRLILELDGYGFHGNRASFESDRRRDQDLVAAGWRVIRITWRQLVEEPMAVLVKIVQALAVS